jgi:hypothetical protein
MGCDRVCGGSALRVQYAEHFVAGNGKSRGQFAYFRCSANPAASELARRLSTDAQARGLKFVPSDESGATHILKGYFSAFGEDGKTTVVFVWDLLDPQGNRLHRIQGQETVAANGGADPWSVVPPETMQAIADRTIDALVPWFTRSSG